MHMGQSQSSGSSVIGCNLERLARLVPSEAVPWDGWGQSHVFKVASSLLSLSAMAWVALESLKCATAVVSPELANTPGSFPLIKIVLPIKAERLLCLQSLFSTEKKETMKQLCQLGKEVASCRGRKFPVFLCVVLLTEWLSPPLV